MLASFSPGSSVSRRRVLDAVRAMWSSKGGSARTTNGENILGDRGSFEHLIDGASVKEGLQLRFEADFSSIHRQMYWQMHARTATAVALNH